MRDLFNLGDLGDPAVPETHPALIDCRNWDRPRTLSHSELDRQINACARGARGKRSRARRSCRDPLAQPRGGVDRLLRDHACRICRDPREHQVSAGDHLVRAGGCRRAICVLRHRRPRAAARGACRSSTSTTRVPTAMPAFSIPARSRRYGRTRAKPRWCSTRRARPAGRRACRCRMMVSCGPCAPASAPAATSVSASWWRHRCFT